MTWTEYRESQSVTDAQCNNCSLTTSFGTFRINKNPFTDTFITHFRNNRLEDKDTLEEAKEYLINKIFKQL